MKNRPAILLISAGIVWLCVSLYLFPLGVRLLMQTLEPPLSETTYSLLTPVENLLGGRSEGVLLLLAVGLLLGMVKGRAVMAKSVEKEAQRISQLSTPSWSEIFSKRQYIVMGVMICIGVGMKFFSVPNDWRGMVDVAVGFALLQGASAYFRNGIMSLRADTQQ